MVLRFIILFIPTLFLTGSLALGITLWILDKMDVNNKFIYYSSITVSILLVAVFVAYPLCKKEAEYSIRNAQRNERIVKDIIKECVVDYLEENDLQMEEEKVNEVSDYIYNEHLYVDSDDYGFWVEEKYLDLLKISLPNAVD